MKVLLINPPQRQYQSSHGFGINVPLGLLYLAAAIRDEFEVRILDCLITGFEIRKHDDRTDFGASPDRIYKEIAAYQPDVVGITIPFSSQSESSHMVGEICRAVNPNITTVFGGPDPSIRYDSLMRKPFCDHCVVGEGERAFLELLQALRDGKQTQGIEGVPWWLGSTIQLTRRRGVKDLDTLPWPAYDMINIESYMQNPYLYKNREFEAMRPRQISVITSRGCPYKCTFCSISLHMGRHYRYHSPENVIRHLKHLIETYDIRDFKFEDDNVSMRPKRFEAILDWIIEADLGLQWSVPNGMRADTLNLPLLEKIKRSGCQKIRIAIESGNPRVLEELVCKGETLEDMLWVARESYRLGLNQAAFYVIGFPGETLDEMRQTVDLALDLWRRYQLAPSLYLATPLFGTQLYDECVSKGYIDENMTDRQLAVATQTCSTAPMIETPEFSRKEILALTKDYAQKRKQIEERHRKSQSHVAA